MLHYFYKILPSLHFDSRKSTNLFYINYLVYLKGFCSLSNIGCMGWGKSEMRTDTEKFIMSGFAHYRLIGNLQSTDGACESV